MKTAISLPDPVFQAADELAGRLGLSRSALYAQAVSEFLEQHRQDGVTERLNAIYSVEAVHLDPVLEELQSASLVEEEW
jgi:predicted transcriptional regulator